MGRKREEGEPEGRSAQASLGKRAAGRRNSDAVGGGGALKERRKEEAPPSFLREERGRKAPARERLRYRRACAIDFPLLGYRRFFLSSSEVQ